MTTLGSAIDDRRAAERRAALRALLARPLLIASGPDRADYLLVRKHAEALRTWLELNVGWQLTVDSAVARLQKRFADSTDGTRGLRDAGKESFTRRRYVLLALALGALERAQNQTTLGRIADEVVNGIADQRFADAGLTFTLDTRRERSDMVAVVRYLMDIGVLALVAGEDRAFLDASGDALYDIERRALATLLVSTVGPSTVGAHTFEARLISAVEHPLDTSDELRNRTIRHNLTRRLLDDPVLYLDELTETERVYLANQRRSITDRIAEATGLVAEVRAEGIAMVDPDDSLTDVRMPESGSHGHLTLLLAEFLAGTDSVSNAEVVDHVVSLIGKFGDKWSKATREPGAEGELARTALDRLERLGLVRINGGMVISRPAIARYASGVPLLIGRKSPVPSQQLEFF